MFGESDSESSRVPSPWDSLIATPASGSPATKPQISSSPLSGEIPKLVPEADDGNVEYKLQLLNPSPARFARLVTQMKWRLLEGGGQAYYELGVSDSGSLVGLARVDLELSLETLEMMAGEIGASVIVVKEIEVPAAMGDLAMSQEDHRRVKKRDEYLDSGGDTSTTTETEPESSAPEDNDISSTIFTMDDPADDQVLDTTGTQFAIDIEIASVFKPRPFRTRHNHPVLSTNSGKRTFKAPKAKKPKSTMSAEKKDEDRRQARDKKRDEKRKALVALASESLLTSCDSLGASTPDSSRQPTLKASALPTDQTEALVSGLEDLHVSMDQPISVALTKDEQIPVINLTAEPLEEDDDVFPTPSAPHPAYSSGGIDIASQTRLIVEALVVRKMSLEETFLDFQGFGL